MPPMNKKPAWYIEENVFKDDPTAQKMVYAIIEEGSELIQEKYIPFEGCNYEFLPTDRTVIFYGSLNCIADYQKRFNHCKPFAWCDFTKFRCQHYYTYYGEHLLQRKYGFYPVAEIRRMKEDLYDMYGVDGLLCIRPDTNDKAFVGGPVKWNGFDRWWKAATDYYQPKEMLCVVSRPEDILAEYRLVVADGKVIAGSQYKKRVYFEPKASYDVKAAELAEKLAAIWVPHPILVMDVAETPEGFRLVEIGPVNAAGLYECDARPIVQAMTAIAEREVYDRTDESS